LTIRSIPSHDGLLYFCDLTAQDPDIEHCRAQIGKDGTVLWLHLCAINPLTREWLDKETDLDPLIVDALLAEDTRPRFLKRTDGALINLRTADSEEAESGEEMISIRVWIADHLVISCRRRDSRAIQDMQAAIVRKEGARDSGQFVSKLTEEIAADIEGVMDVVGDRISMAEVHIAGGNQEACHDIPPIRRRVARLAHYILPQASAIQGLLNAKLPWITDDVHSSLVESHDQHTRHVEDLSNIRDRSQILNEEIRNIQSTRLNSITYLFSVAATIFLPLSFLTGLLGVNVGGMPGLDSSTAFWILVGLCTGIVAFQIALFKKLKWF